MRLTEIRVKDFRSLVDEHVLTLANGVNYLVGPNNAGKSNIIRAVSLALDEDAAYDPTLDRPVRENPSGGAPRKTRITLSFAIENSNPEQTLRRLAKAYEQALRGRRPARFGQTATFAEDRIIKLVTEFGPNGSRITSFQAKAEGARSLPTTSKEHLELLKQFRSVMRFAVVQSGEDLVSLLGGKFREILQLVITDHLKEQVAAAETARTTYLNSLQTELLEPLRELIQKRVGKVFGEITSAELVPQVPTISQTLGSVDIRLGDSVTTSLTSKGTGVRGAVLLALLRYLAEQSKRSIVIAVEEPEAFLHPAAQEAIRDELAELAKEYGVSLLITTHSPYVIARTQDSRIASIEKDANGSTRIAASVVGDAPLSPTLASLYRDPFMSEVVERSLAVPSTAKLVVVTEGFTDWSLVSMCCQAAGVQGLLEGIHVIPARGANSVVPQSVLAAAGTKLPVIALVDWDDNGRAAQKKLESFGWSKNTQILSLLKWPGSCASSHDVEIEDLVPADAAKSLLDELGYHIGVSKHERCGSTDRWHTAYSDAWKAAAVGDDRDPLKVIVPRLPPLLGNSSDPAGGMRWLVEELWRRANAMTRKT